MSRLRIDPLSGLPVHYSRHLARTTDGYVVEGIGAVFFSETAMILGLGGVHWHDEGHHCPTWSEGCRCDLAEGA